MCGLIAAIIVSLILSTFATDMLIYDEGNVYSCPVDSLISPNGNDDEGKAYDID